MSHTKIVRDNPIETLRLCGGYYEAPERDGEICGPLVGYARQYDAPDGTKKQWVGKIYYNFARAEENPAVLQYFASGILKQLCSARIVPLAFLGAPMGGIRLAGALGDLTGLRVIYAEKKVIKPESGREREEAELILDRYDIEKGEAVVIVEDVCNNFSTTSELVKLVERNGGKVIGIACAINRSGRPWFTEFTPVISFVFKPTGQHRQEEYWVWEAIAKYGLVKKPKHEWSRLKEAMEKFRDENK